MDQIEARKQSQEDMQKSSFVSGRLFFIILKGYYVIIALKHRISIMYEHLD